MSSSSYGDDNIFHLEGVDQCPVCYEDLINQSPLTCGHTIHTSCLEKHFRAECPVCRKPHTRVVPKGKVPKSSAGRSVRYISPNAKDERVIIEPFSKDYEKKDKELIEEFMTKKHRGILLSKKEAEIYTSAVKKIGGFNLFIK